MSKKESITVNLAMVDAVYWPMYNVVDDAVGQAVYVAVDWAVDRAMREVVYWTVEVAVDRDVEQPMDPNAPPCWGSWGDV
jgi:hypothetical protein